MIKPARCLRPVSVQMDETLSPAAATTAEEAMASPGEGRDPPRTAPREAAPFRRVSSGELRGAASAVAPTGREESGLEAETWAAAVPPVRAPVARTTASIPCPPAVVY